MNSSPARNQTAIITPQQTPITTTKNPINMPQNQNMFITTPNSTINKDFPPHNTHHNDSPESSNARNQPPKIPRSFLYSETDIHEGIQACNHSIIGKIITNKPIHINSIQNGLDNIWGSPPGLKIQELGRRILQFFMNDLADKDRILLGNPWIFRNAWLVVKPWDRETDVHTIDFDHVPIWVQLWGLPPHCKTKQMGESIGALMGQVEAAEYYEYPGKKVIIKIKVAINIHNPILSGIHVGNPIDDTCWVDYRYEKLPQVCFNCGLIGHMDKLCRNQTLNLDTLAPIGPWIRSTQYGKRKMEEKDRKYYSNPSQAKNFGQYSPPVPSDLLDKLAALRVNNASANQPEKPQKYTEESPMEGVKHQYEGRDKKAHRLSYNNDKLQQDQSTASTNMETTTYGKRQKTEEIQRAGTASQASPRP
jgi:hypothetical protein